MKKAFENNIKYNYFVLKRPLLSIAGLRNRADLIHDTNKTCCDELIPHSHAHADASEVRDGDDLINVGTAAAPGSQCWIIPRAGRTRENCVM